jgi:hypothetical protein
MALNNGQALSLASMQCKDGGPISPGRCFLSREAHQESKRLIREWADFTRDLQAARMPSDISFEAIAELRLRWGMGRNQRKP